MGSPGLHIGSYPRQGACRYLTFWELPDWIFRMVGGLVRLV